MKKLVLLLIAAVCMGMGTLAQNTSLLVPQKGIGAKYGTRDPMTCSSKKEPAKGAPSPELATQYVICGKTGEREVSDQTLYLMQDVQVEVGNGRSFQGGGLSDINMRDIDPSLPVYPIRGKYTLYRCTKLGMFGGDPGKNCWIYDHPEAEGACYKTTFGDWSCKMADMSKGTNPRRTNNGKGVPMTFPGPK